jgi:hypothetical protein
MDYEQDSIIYRLNFWAVERLHPYKNSLYDRNIDYPRTVFKKK